MSRLGLTHRGSGRALRAAGHPVIDTDAARLSPLGHEHINLLGRYAFPRPSTHPVLRTLREPGAADDARD